MKFARTENGIVVETFTEPKEFTIHECFTPELVQQFEPCAEEVEAGWFKQENAFVQSLA